jgi:hypothetical protein
MIFYFKNKIKPLIRFGLGRTSLISQDCYLDSFKLLGHSQLKVHGNVAF